MVVSGHWDAYTKPPWSRHTLQILAWSCRQVCKLQSSAGYIYTEKNQFNDHTKFPRLTHLQMITLSPLLWRFIGMWLAGWTRRLEPSAIHRSATSPWWRALFSSSGGSGSPKLIMESFSPPPQFRSAHLREVEWSNPCLASLQTPT